MGAETDRCKMMERMGVKSLQGRPFTDSLLHNRMYLSHVYEEYGVAMLTQHGIKCRIDRRKHHSDILTEGGLRIEIKSSGRIDTKKKMDDGTYWDSYNVCNHKRAEFSQKVIESDFFIFISEIGKCVFIVPTHEIESLGRRFMTIPWTEERLAGNFRKATFRHKESTSSLLFRHKNAWYLIERAERDRKNEQTK